MDPKFVGGLTVGLTASALLAYWLRRSDQVFDEDDTHTQGAATTHSGPTLTHAVGYQELRAKSAKLKFDQEAMKATFSELAGDDEILDFKEFSELLKNQLQIDLCEDELLRIWNRVVSSGTDPQQLVRSPSSAKKQGVTFSQFVHGVENVTFLRHIVSQYRTRSMSNSSMFSVPQDYDYAKSTNENYGDKTKPLRFFGQHQALREKVNYSYHSNYTEARQLWQDDAINSVVVRTKPQPTPWIVYTCGPVGAGKGYALSWMSRNGYFPLEDIVHIDPDHFKKLMPEWEGYTERSDRAGDFCHRESGFMQEIAQEVAMRNSQNVWVDGTLRDGPWFEKVFQDVRRRFPKYKIAIFEVGAGEKVVRERIAKRARETGRDVPEHVIQASLRSVASSLDLLTPLSDFVARINNEGTKPELRAYIRIDASRDWGLIQAQFAKPETGTFPNSLAPLALIPLGEEKSRKLFTSHKDHCITLNKSLEGLQNIRGAIKSSTLRLSPDSHVTLRPEVKKLAGIPTKAASFAFAYPAAEVNWEKLPPGSDLSDPACQVPLAGAFVYFDEKGKPCGVSSICGFVDDKTGYSMLQFAAPIHLPQSAVKALGGRLQPVTLAPLLDKGAKTFGWIKPGEKLPDLHAPPAAGAFAYVLDNDAIYFPVVDED